MKIPCTLNFDAALQIFQILGSKVFVVIPNMLEPGSVYRKVTVWVGCPEHLLCSGDGELSLNLDIPGSETTRILIEDFTTGDISKLQKHFVNDFEPVRMKNMTVFYASVHAQ